MRWFRSQLQLTVRVQHAQNPLLYNADVILLSDIAPNPIAEKNDTVENDNISTETKNTLGSTSTVDQPVQNANADNEFLARIQRSTVAALLQNMKLVKAELRSDAPLPVPGSPVTDDAVLTRLRAVMLPSLQRVQQDDGRRLGVGESKQELRAEDIVIESITQMVREFSWLIVGLVRNSLRFPPCRLYCIIGRSKPRRSCRAVACVRAKTLSWCSAARRSTTHRILAWSTLSVSLSAAMCLLSCCVC